MTLKQNMYPVLTLPNDWYDGIGECIFKWATLEYFIQTIIWTALGLKQQEGRVLTLGMASQTLNGIARNAAKNWIGDDALQQELIDLMEEYQTQIEFRNCLAHGIWMADPNDADGVPWLSYMKAAHERITPSAEPVTPQALKGFGQKVHELNVRAVKFLEKLVAHKASQEISFSPIHAG